MSKKIIRLIALFVIPAAVLAFILTDQYYRASAQIRSFPGQVLVSYPGTDFHFEPSLSARLFFNPEASGISRVMDILEGRETDNTTELSPESSGYLNSSLPLPLLMYRSYADSDRQGCLRLADLWNQPPSALFRCAAELDAGRIGSAGNILESLPEEERNTWLGKRLTRLITPAVTGASSETRVPVTIFDRKGIPLGILANRKLSVFPEHGNLHLPREALEESISGRGAAPDPGMRASIDLRIQRAAVESLGGYRGSIVVLNSHTGEVLAAASDSRTQRQNPTAPFTQQYEPASISKLVTSNAALRAGIDVDEFMENTVCNGGKRYSGKILWCSYRSGRLGTLAKALADSCNIAFADLGVAAGRKAVLDELAIFGYDRAPSGPFHFGKIVNKNGDNRQLADLSIGLESTTVTPAHAALLATPFANDGIMPEPTLLFASDGFTGLSPAEYSRPPGSWIVNDPDSLKIIRDAMREVALNGTARGMSENGFPVAMKTGTGRTSGTGYVTNYIGYGPLPDTRISFCLRITHQSTSSRVRRATRAVLADFLHRLSELEKTRGDD